MINKINLNLIDTTDATDGETIAYSSNSNSFEFSAYAGGAGVIVYATAEELPTSGNTLGDKAYVSNTNKFYYWANRWKNIPLTVVL